MKFNELQYICGGRDMVWVVLTLLVIGLATYGFILHLRNKYTHEIEAIDEQKVAVFDIPVDSVILKLKNMHLSGKTKRLYESWAERWDLLIKENLPAIEAELDSAEQSVDQLNVLKTKKSIERARQLVDEAEKSAFQIDEALQRIVESDSQNHEEIEGVSNKYRELRNFVLADRTKYGDAYPTIEGQLEDLEALLGQFHTLMEEADYIEAREVLQQVEKNTHHVSEKIDRVPALLQTFDVDYIEQVAELKQGYEQLVAQSYQFDESVSVTDELDRVESDIASVRKDVISLHLDNVKSGQERIEQHIDKVYDMLESEIEAKEYIQKHQLGLEGRLKQIMANNKLVATEIEKTSNNYELTDNESEAIEAFYTELEKESDALDHYKTELENKQVVYSKVKQRFEEMGQTLARIDKGQATILNDVSGLRQREKEVREQLELFEVDLRNMKRSLEKQHLPGLDKTYLDLFFATTKRIETLSENLNRIRINMKEIDEQLALCTSDVEKLDEETETIIDSALLTERLIQYANRYRMEYAAIEKAITVALNLYTHQFKYEQAKQTIAVELNKVERGAVERVTRLYHEDKNRRLF